MNPSPTSGSRGVFISNASPRILNCEIRGHNSNPAGGGAGVCITGLSYPSFVDCTIRDNRCSDGAGVKVRGLNTDNPAPEFIRCRFVSNESSQLDGGAVRLEYDTALDSSNTQPSFVDCEIDSNISRRGGAAVYLINCHSPVFVGCSFLGNEVNSAHAADGIIDGYQSGGVFSHCTFVGNVSFHDNTQDVFMLGPVSGISKPIKINRTIVAFNEGAAVYAPWANEYDVSNSDFFGNREADDYWLTSGQDNFNVDPSFCDQPNGDCTLYAFSSCSYALSPVGRVGAFGVGCVPDCAVTSFPDTSTMFPGDSIFFSCPQGDSAGMALRLSVDFEESQMTRALEPSEIFLEQFSYAPFSSFGAGLLTADSTADSASGFYTTVAHEFLGGCGTAAIAVNLNGELLAERPTVTVKSPDLDGDGDVHTTDLATFGLAFPSCRDSTNYNDCADYSADGCVSMADLSMWAPHWMHEYQPPLASVAAAQPPESGIRLQLSFMEVRASGTQHKLFVTVALDNLGAFDVLCFVLRNENNLLEYVGWQ